MCSYRIYRIRGNARNRFRNYNKSPKEKRTYNGIVYDSQSEMRRAIELEKLEKNGDIKNLQRQVTYELQPAFVSNNGEKIRSIKYIADFVYEKGGKTIVEDVKTYMTVKLPEYVLKKKMFLYKYTDLVFFENLTK